MKDSLTRSKQPQSSVTPFRSTPGLLSRLWAVVHSGESGRSLPAALITLAAGALLLTPFLSFVSTRSLGGQALNETFNEQYAADAGVEFGIWTVLNNPSFRAQIDLDPGIPYTVTFPETINDISQTDIYVNVTAIPIGEWTWNPPPFPPVTFNHGGDMIYTGGNFIYALQGGNSKGFWRYNINTLNWVAMKNTKRIVKQEGGLVYPGGGFIYAFFDNKSQGKGKGNQSDFWRYSISNDNWKKMEPTPTKIGKDTALTSRGGTIYIIPGKQNKFWAYDINDDKWGSLANIPGKAKSGTSLTAVGGGYLYALEGNSNQFWRYNLSGDSWTTLQATPDSVKDGGALAYNGGNYIYATGGSSTAFWRYNIANDSWAVLTNAPGSIGAGGALVFTDSDGGYALQGNGSSSFWRFDVTPPQYDIQSTANDVTITARIEIDGTNKTILFWDIE